MLRRAKLSTGLGRPVPELGHAVTMPDWMHAADDHGIVTLHDLKSAGLTPRDVSRLRRSGELTKVARSWYAVGPVPDDEDRHVLATQAMLRSHGGRAVAGSYSALLHWGLPTFGADLAVVRLSRRTPGPTNTTPTCRLGRAVPERLQGEVTVVPALAVVQHGTSNGPMAALIAADGALRVGLATRAALDDALAVTRHHPHSGGIASLLAHADGRHESPGETRLAHVLRLLAIRATPQVTIEEGGRRAVVDVMLDDDPVVIEFDGRVKYGRDEHEPDPFGRRRPPSEVLWDEKRREDWIRERGYEMVRVVNADLDGPGELRRRIDQAVHRARSRRRTA